MLAPATLTTLRNFARAGLIPQDDVEDICRTVSGAASGAPVLLTAKEAARRCACSVRTVHRLASDGRLRKVYLSPGKAKSLRFPEADVNAVVTGSAAASEG